MNQVLLPVYLYIAPSKLWPAVFKEENAKFGHGACRSDRWFVNAAILPDEIFIQSRV